MRRAFAAMLIALLLIPAAAKADAAPAQALCLIEANSGRIIEEHNAHARLPMASTTKIMTALLAAESGRLRETVRITEEAVGVEGSSMYLKAGETMPLLDLVYGLMLRSGNDAAVAIACFLDGSVAAFVERMNERARELGLIDTHFENPNGLPNEAHYTSAYDLAQLGAAALRNPIFSDIVGTRYYETTGDTLRTLKNKNRLLWEYEGGIGIKTGYTKAAGKCLVFAAERGGMKLVGALLNCPTMWDSAKSMLDAGFSEFSATPVFGTDTVFWIPVQNGAKKALCAAPISAILYPMKADGSEQWSVQTALPDAVDAPVSAGDAIGTATLVLNGEPVLTVPIIALETVGTRGFLEYLRRAITAYCA